MSGLSERQHYPGCVPVSQGVCDWRGWCLGCLRGSIILAVSRCPKVFVTGGVGVWAV